VVPRPFRVRLWQLLEVETQPDAGRRFDWFDVSLAVLIVLNVVAIVLQTVPAIDARHGRLLDAFDDACVAVFVVEYVLRLWTCTVDPRYAGAVHGRLHYATRPLQLIDLLSILPAVLPYVGGDWQMLRVFRLFRILRVLKLGRYSSAIGTLARVLTDRRGELGVMAVALLVLVVLAGSLMYHIERDGNGEQFSSIPQSMWWAVVTLTTIGYGDIYPKSPLGQFVGGLTAVFGIGIVALPTAIVAQGFADALREQRQRRAGVANTTTPAPSTPTCPHCGKPLDVHASHPPT